MKKSIIVFFNIVFILIIFMFANFAIFYLEITKNYTNPNIKDIILEYKNFLSRDISYKDSFENLILSKNIRKVENKYSKEKPVLIFGCSFAEGFR